MRKIGIKEQVTKGDRFGRWTVIKEVEGISYPPNTRIRRFLCACDCGNEKVVRYDYLKNGRCKSCGCLVLETNKKHRKYDDSIACSRLYRIWWTMKQRCYYKKSISYSNYGAKGITICKEWLNDFTSFYNWSIENGYADNLTLDRINGEGNYEPSNCRWVSYTEQANNMKSNVYLTLNGESHTYAEWGRILGIRSATLQQRKYAGWSDERTLTTPVRRKSINYMKGE